MTRPVRIERMLIGMRETERVSVTLPTREENLEEFLADMAATRGGPVDDDARARASVLMRLARGD